MAAGSSDQETTGPLPCPRCRTPLGPAASGHACLTCRGQWLTEAALADLLARMGQRPSRPAFVLRSGERRMGCPVCREPLELVTLDTVPVERCEAYHGVWFDAQELSAVLYQAGTAPRPHEQNTSRSVWDLVGSLLWLK